MTLTLLPTAEKAVVHFLTNDPDLSAQCGGRAGTKLNATLPAWRVTRVGGIPDDPYCDRPSVQLEAWAVDQATASAMMRTLLAALPRIRGLHTDAGIVYTYAVTSGPFWSPDDPSLSTNARYITTIDLLTTPDS
jgi:hypothetical protein